MGNYSYGASTFPDEEVVGIVMLESPAETVSCVEQEFSRKNVTYGQLLDPDGHLVEV